MLAGFIKTMQAEEMQNHKTYINILLGNTEKWREKKATFQLITYRLYIWKVVRKSIARYNDKLQSFKCGRIVPPFRWDGPDWLPMEVRS